MSPETLRAHRAELRGVYATAQRRHRDQARAAEHLRAATTALLKAELPQARPRRGRPSKSRPVNPSLFEEFYP